jgi:hypothetical protein
MFESTSAPVFESGNLEMMKNRLNYCWLRRTATCTCMALALLCIAPNTFASGHGASHAAAEVEEEIEVGADVKIRGIKLGEFQIRSFHLVEAQKCTVRFLLYASVASERYADVRHLVEQHENRVRDQVITATRMAPLIVFDEPDLASFRRRIFLRLRRALPELVIADVHVSEFQLTVKSI